ncbi:MAG: MFS transporter, partial [Actinomycetales bacterium]
MKHPLRTLDTAVADRLVRNRDFLVASASRFVAMVGYSAVVVVILLHLQGSLAGPEGVWAVTAYLLVATLPMVVLAPWAGRLADTHDSRFLACAASAASAAALAAMALSIHLFADFNPALFVLTFILEAALAVASPTWQALLPRIVGEKRTPKAMGTMQATLMLAQLVGPAAGGILAGQGGTELAFWLAAACYLVLAAGAVSIRTRRGGVSVQAEAGSGTLAGHGATPERPRLLDGLRVLNADSLLWSLMVGAMFVVLTAEAINVLE